MHVLLLSLNESIKRRVRHWLGVPEPVTEETWEAIARETRRAIGRIRFDVSG